jgi:hypothetical protein
VFHRNIIFPCMKNERNFFLVIHEPLLSYELEWHEDAWHSGGKIATPAVTETITRVRVPCVVAYTVIEAMVHRLASSKHANPVQCHHDQESRSGQICRLTMISDPSRGFSSTEMPKNVPCYYLLYSLLGDLCGVGRETLGWGFHQIHPSESTH